MVSVDIGSLLHEIGRGLRSQHTSKVDLDAETWFRKKTFKGMSSSRRCIAEALAKDPENIIQGIVHCQNDAQVLRSLEM